MSSTRASIAAEPGLVVWSPFPFVERFGGKFRPALIVSGLIEGPQSGLLWAMMVTSADRAGWPGDVMIADHEKAGLPIPSKVRTAKLTAITPLRLERAGTVDSTVLAAVRHHIRFNLGVPARP